MSMQLTNFWHLLFKGNIPKWADGRFKPKASETFPNMVKRTHGGFHIRPFGYGGTGGTIRHFSSGEFLVYWSTSTWSRSLSVVAYTPLPWVILYTWLHIPFRDDRVTKRPSWALSVSEWCKRSDRTFQPVPFNIDDIHFDVDMKMSAAPTWLVASRSDHYFE